MADDVTGGQGVAPEDPRSSRVGTHLVVGATGATGRLLVRRLLEREQHVRVIVRAAERLPDDLRDHPRLDVTEASLLELDEAALARHVDDVDGVASCLGHTLSVGGLFGPPWRLVADAVRRLTAAVRVVGPEQPVRFVLMNTTGVRDRALAERTSAAQRVVVGLLHVLLPPHADNEAAAARLRRDIAPDDPHLQWAAVRPDGLHDVEHVTPYDVHPSPTRSAIFDAGRTSRLNVADFMAALLTDDELWARWKGRMPVIYDREE